MNLLNNKQKVLIILVLLLSLVVIISYLFLPKDSKPVSTPSPTSLSNLRSQPIKMADVPYKPSDQGGGVDTGAQKVVDSKNEIKKLVNAFPYEQNFQTTSGKKVTILIPGADLQLNPWTLTVQIFGIDYQTSPEYEDYQSEKNAFVESANLVFGWMKSQGVNPDKIIISWGGKEFIQQRAEEWLNQQ